MREIIVIGFCKHDKEKLWPSYTRRKKILNLLFDADTDRSSFLNEREKDRERELDDKEY